MIDLSNPAQRARFFDVPDRRTAVILGAIAGVLFIALMTVVLPAKSRIAALLLDRNSPHFSYPFTIQNFEHILFFIGLGELFVRWRIGDRENAFVRRKYLPEDDQTVLQLSDLGPVRRRVASEFDNEHGFVPYLIDLSILQLQSSRSVDQTVAVMNSSLELIQHRVDLRYNIIRYIAWLGPTLGFIGTVMGLGASLAAVPSSGEVNLSEVAHMLAVGFDCTMVALVESAILVFFLHITQEREEHAVNLAGQYTLRNLINRLYVPDARSATLVQ